MELKKLTVHNYKSLVNFELNEPNAFTVFAGPNGAGKSNIFEALEFINYCTKVRNVTEVENLFRGRNSFSNFKSNNQKYSVCLLFNEFNSSVNYTDEYGEESGMEGIWNSDGLPPNNQNRNRDFEDLSLKGQIWRIFFENFLRFFIGKTELKKISYTSNERLLPDASNLESVLKRILKDEAIKEEFLEWLDLFIPGFSNIEVHSDNIGGTDTLLIYEKGTTKPFTKNLISDGTYNILALLTAVYQTNEPQFLCIEEPENGLNPYVVRKIVDFFRQQCEEKGHVIWLNTHSQTLVSKLKPEELVMVEKKGGETVIKQFPKDYNLHGLDMDEAWLSNALGRGLPW